MNEVVKKLQIVQEKIHSTNEVERLEEQQETFTYCESKNLFKIFFYGNPFDNNFEYVLKALSDQQVAATIKSIELKCPDEGVNGTIFWDFSTLINSRVVFPHMTNFSVQLTEPTHHNTNLIGSDYEENGMTAGLIKKMPNLRSLTIPSAPNSSFFEMNSHSLELLKIQVGFDSQNFISNLSFSTCFPHLYFLNFTDFQETYLENWQSNCTTFEDFQKLFTSDAFNSIRLLILQNVLLSTEQLSKLKSFRKDLSIKVVKSTSKYV
jgi:hypothetical protein